MEIKNHKSYFLTNKLPFNLKINKFLSFYYKSIFY